ncbi:YraN family protein [Desulfolutivibrio sulfoxidireducens]|uniref:YraN family protein n=1 Tax=Desulfolutivibrio sulfoxidireducens TaxID=2773299 RepID=UPI00159E8A1D|nr:YraN family protein [Desulfolutivibrio sulfoxidireducens]QLA20759.1 YraN family protein [Desulfolutivibrio sulfoxidireducens]
MPTAPHLATGQRGENAALDHLLARGWRIVARNWRCPKGEIDFVCQTDDTLVFVEVKTRAASPQADPAGAVTASKRSRLVKAAMAYLSRHEAWDQPCRFDVVTILETPAGPRVGHIENAFDASAYMGRGYQPF